MVESTHVDQNDDPAPVGGPRKLQAAKTKAAILASARQAFAESGYDGAGLRAIAEKAGVTAMMIGRYYGSKEQLFAEVVAASMADPVILRPENVDSDSVARRLASALVTVTQPGDHPLDGFLILFRSASSPVAAKIAREQIASIHQRTAARAARGDHPDQRAAILLAFVAGMQTMRQMIELTALVDAEPEVLVDLLTPIIERILD